MLLTGKNAVVHGGAGSIGGAAATLNVSAGAQLD
jgi:NAD(P)-dependent dehydrogenase (short-subunit alcohol dehydrogenase family)